MESFSWEPWFETGLVRVDEQHRHLVGIINRFGHLIVQAEGVAAVDVESVFGELAAYAREHFLEEETLMAQAQLDARHRTLHHHEHARFLEAVGRLHAGMGEPGADRRMGAHKLLQFMVDWLAYHILGSDQTMALQLAAVNDGATPETAYEQVQLRRDPATATLLQALDRLFRQVSDRNLELHELNRSLEARVAERTHELSLSNQRLQDMALTDALTGLANRRHAMSRLLLEWGEPTRPSRPLACIMLDADNFKQINDRWGHAAGDLVLQALAHRLEAAVRTDDTVCRLGGDEFLVICANTTLAGALEIADKLHRAVKAEPISLGGASWDASISLGVAVRQAGMGHVESLLKAADAALYRAKGQGRNRIAAAPA